VLGNRRAVLARELTKIHEEFLRLSLEDLIVKYGAEEPRGEFVVMVAGKSSDD